MNRLRNRLILVFIAATLLPLGLTLWTMLELIERSLGLAPFAELDTVSRSLEKTGRELYRASCEALRRDAAGGKIEPRKLTAAEAQAFLDSGLNERCELAGPRKSRLDEYVRRGDEVFVYSRPMGIAMDDLTDQYASAREALRTSSAHDVRRGFNSVLILIVSAVWLVSLGALIYLAHRISHPVQQLTQGLKRVAAGDLKARVEPGGGDEIGAAVAAFNNMAGQLQQARERLIHVTRLASWQALARKMAHEVKNSLTPIRLTMEEIISRRDPDRAFLETAAQIVADEVTTLEKRVRAFSEFASEPPVMPDEIDVNALVEERISFLRSAHPEISYDLRLAPERPRVVADPDLIKGVLTNLLENAAEAAQPRGTVLAATAVEGETLRIEVHDSGPGLSAQARSTLFEPSISFKKGGMGLGLSIARRSALLCGGDLETLDGELGGAGFRIILTRSQEPGARSQNGKPSNFDR